MLAFPTIMDVAALAMAAFSPSKTCKVRVSSTRYRNDPYRARVLPYAQPTSYAMPQMAFAPTRVAQAFHPSAPTAAPSPVKAPVVSAMATMMQKAAAAQLPRKTVAEVVAVAPVVVAPVPTAPVEVAFEATGVATDARKQHYAVVGFKHETAMYQAPFRVAVGDVVVVEADRGEHIGVVQSITTTAPRFNVPSRIVRRADATEAAVIDELTEKEKRVTAAVQKLAESNGLGIRVVDVEFQMDHNKLTVFFSSKVFVDFRKLQRSLFREFRCRIWLVNWVEVRPYTPVPVNPAV